MKVDSNIKQHMGLTPSQEGVLTLAGEDIVVEAAAGSGKTRSLVARYLFLLEQGAADLDGIVAITFTENAASEMRERIRKEIAKYINKFGEKGFLSHGALKKLQYAQISTIHGFAARILKENPFEAGITPDFGILEGYQREQFFDEALKEFIQINLEQDELGESAQIPELLASAGYDVRTVRERLAEILALAQRLHIEPPWNAYFHDVPGDVSSKDIVGECKNKNVELAKIVSKSAYQRRCDEIRDGCLKLEAKLSPSRSTQIFGEFKEKAEWIAYHAKASDEERSLAELIKGLAENAILSYESKLTDLFLGAAEKAHSHIQKKKNDEGVMEFEDLLIKARDLLYGNKQLLAHYREKFKFIIIDEFQDTDSVQMGLIRLLSERGGAGLFVVGDPKQSVYRFRGAEPKIFRDLKKKPRHTFHLKSNYRTEGNLLGFYNELFKGVFNDDNNDFVDMVPIKNENPEAEPVELLISLDTSAKLARDREAASIAERVRELCDQGYHYKDIAILVRNTKHMGLYEDALRRVGIPFYSSAGGNIFESPVIRDIRVLLSLLLNPDDMIAEASVLRGPFLGASDDDLFTHFATGNSVERIEEFLSFMGELRMGVLGMQPSAALQHVLEKTGYKGFVLKSQGAKEDFKSLEKFQSAVSALEGTGMALAEIVEAFEGGYGEELQMDEGDDLSIGDRVSVLTVHKAKGLEYPVVIVADANHSIPNNSKTVNAGKEKFLVSYGSAKSAPREELGEMEKHDVVEEEKRILYVALTRAEQKLVLSIAGKELKDGNLGINKDSFASLCLDALGLKKVVAGIDSIPFGERTIPILYGSQYGSEKAAGDITSNAELTDAGAAKEFVVGELDLGEFESRFEPVGSQVELDAEEMVPELSVSTEYNQTLKGEVMHSFLELWDRQRSSVERYKSFVLHKHMVTGDSFDEMLSTLAGNFLDSELYETIQHSSSVFREIAYTFLENGKEARGRIDLLVKLGEKLCLYDYKFVSDEQALRKNADYKKQMNRYSKAVASLFDGIVPECYFVMIPEVRLIKV